MKQRKFNKGKAATFPVFSGSRIGEVLEVGADKEYITVDAAFDYIATKTFANSSNFSGTVTATAGSASITGTGFNSISADNYLQVGANYWAIKSIESDNNATLWHGAQATVSGSLATYKVLQEFTFEIFGDQTVTAKTLPSGVSVLIVGNSAKHKLIFSAGITISAQFKLEITNLRFVLNISSGAILGGFAVGRGILHLHDFDLTSDEPDNILMAVGLASYIEDNVIIHGARRTISTDYLLINSSLLSADGVSDHILMQQNIVTDIGHPYTVNNYKSHSFNDSVVSGQSSGFEINGTQPGKIVDVNDSTLIALHSTAPALPNAAQIVWGDAGAILNFTDCIIDCVNNIYEIQARGATINLVRTTRSDGSAVRQN